MRTTVSRWSCTAALAAAFAASCLSGCYSSGGWSMPRLASLNPMNWGKSGAGSSLAKGGPSPPSIQMSPTSPDSALAGGGGRPASYQNQTAGGSMYAAQQTGGYNTGPYATGGAAGQSAHSHSHDGYYTADQRSSPGYGYGQSSAGAQNPYGAGSTNYGAGSNYPSAGGGGYSANGQGTSTNGQGASSYGQGTGTYTQPSYGAGATGAGTTGSYGDGSSSWDQGGSGYGAGSTNYGAGGSSYGAGTYGTGGTGGSTYGAGGTGSSTYGGDSGNYGSGNGSGSYSPGSASPGYGSTRPSGESKASETTTPKTASLSMPGELLQRSGDYAPGSIRRTQLASAAPVRPASYETEAESSPGKTSGSGGAFAGNPLPGFGLPSYQ